MLTLKVLFTFYAALNITDCATGTIECKYKNYPMKQSAGSP